MVAVFMAQLGERRLRNVPQYVKQHDARAGEFPVQADLPKTLAPAALTVERSTRTR